MADYIFLVGYYHAAFRSSRLKWRPPTWVLRSHCQPELAADQSSRDRRFMLSQCDCQWTTNPAKPGSDPARPGVLPCPQPSTTLKPRALCRPRPASSARQRPRQTRSTGRLVPVRLEAVRCFWPSAIVLYPRCVAHDATRIILAMQAPAPMCTPKYADAAVRA